MTQDWFWTPEWQAGERQVDADLAAGKPGQVFGSDEEFLAALAAGVDDPSVLREKRPAIPVGRLGVRACGGGGGI